MARVGISGARKLCLIEFLGLFFILLSVSTIPIRCTIRSGGCLCQRLPFEPPFDADQWPCLDFLDDCFGRRLWQTSAGQLAVEFSVCHPSLEMGRQQSLWRIRPATLTVEVHLS